MQMGLWQFATGFLPTGLARLIAESSARRAARRDLCPLLAKSGDHLIDDIGLTRNDIRALTDRWED